MVHAGIAILAAEVARSEKRVAETAIEESAGRSCF
jgi:hypothetical protein